MPGNPNVMRRWWKKVKKNRKRTNTTSSTVLEGEVSSTSESGFEESVEIGSFLGSTESEGENNTHEAPENLEIFNQYLDPCPTAPENKNNLRCTVGEVKGYNKEGLYDVLISCSMKDECKVMKFVGILEKQNLKVCLPQRDMLAGLSLPLVIPELVTKRCKYTVLCLSPSFFSDKECLAQAELAQWLSAGQRYKNCLLVKLENFEDAVSEQHSSFNTLFKLVNVIDLSTNGAWEFPTLLERLRS